MVYLNRAISLRRNLELLKEPPYYLPTNKFRGHQKLLKDGTLKEVSIPLSHEQRKFVILNDKETMKKFIFHVSKEIILKKTRTFGEKTFPEEAWSFFQSKIDLLVEECFNGNFQSPDELFKLLP